MAPTVLKQVHMKIKLQNLTRFQQLFLQQTFISLVSLMKKVILSIIRMKKLNLFIH